MNSKISKRAFTKVEVTNNTVSGSMLFRKFEAWCEAEPSVLMWEVTYEEAPVRQFIATTGNNVGKEAETAGGNWKIEFQFVRANKGIEGGFFGDTAIIAGFIRNTLEVVDGRSQPAYSLSINSRSLRGEQIFLSAADLWRILTELGVKRS
ncbi:MAG: hypothetical protein WC473_04880 [Patescibacteria group bacterium]